MHGLYEVLFVACPRRASYPELVGEAPSHVRDAVKAWVGLWRLIITCQPPRRRFSSEGSYFFLKLRQVHKLQNASYFLITFYVVREEKSGLTLSWQGSFYWANSIGLRLGITEIKHEPWLEESFPFLQIQWCSSQTCDLIRFTKNLVIACAQPFRSDGGYQKTASLMLYLLKDVGAYREILNSSVLRNRSFLYCLMIIFVAFSRQK